MSVYRPKGSPFYHFDFWRRGDRFYGSTERSTKREAEAVEAAERERAKRQQDTAAASRASLRIDDVAGRYWLEVGQHHAGKDNTFRDMARLVSYFGKDKLLTDIHDDEVAQLVAWRRGHRVQRSKKTKLKDCPLISNASVNRSTIEPLKKLFTRAKLWGVRFEAEPQWGTKSDNPGRRGHLLPEAEERVRELVGDEAQRLATDWNGQALQRPAQSTKLRTRSDYAPFFEFVSAAGFRRRECLLRWVDVKWSTGMIEKRGKGGRMVRTPITPTIRSILWPLRGHHPTWVFTYVAQRSRDGRVKGSRYPITYSGAKIAWRRLRKRAGVVDFRFHDFRHDIGTKVLRETGNLKLVQKILNHRNIKTTVRYAHVDDTEVAAALEFNAKSRKKSRTRSTKVA